jgi:site-specific DNA-methyltransferase (adenine-specific)
MSYQLFIGDCIESMQAMPDQSVNCCVTSPPYYGLRDYGVEGQIGLEQTPEAFIARLVAVFREVRRVLHDDGTLWVNMGDSYATTSTYNAPRTSAGDFGRVAGSRQPAAKIPNGLKAKDLLGIPWALAFALRADGWYLRQDIIWHKPNPMPESVRDRCTKAHEYIFLLSKSPQYFFDHEAMKEPVQSDKGNTKSFRGGAYVNNSTFDNSTGGNRTVTGNTRSRRNSFKRDGSKRAQVIPGQTVGTHRPGRDESAWDTGMRNRRDVWSVATRGYAGAHFATFPPALIEPCILAGCPVGGTVLDPFGGSGTTAGVALVHGRKAILCELNPDYAALVPARIDQIIGSSVKRKEAAA